jgi:aspartate kinase
MNPTPSLSVPSAANPGLCPVVMKFGGTSVQDTAAFERVAAIIRRQQGQPPRQQPVVVVSAMAGMTDALLDAVKRSLEQDTTAALEWLEPHFARYSEVAERLTEGSAYGEFVHVLYAARERIAQALEVMRRYPGTIPPLRDEVVAYGEHLSAALLTAVLAGDGTPCRTVDARTCIVTDDVYGRARPRWEATQAYTRQVLGPLLAEGVIPVLGGFIGATFDGATTTDRALLCVVGNFGTEATELHPALSEILAEFRSTPLLPHPSPHARLFLLAEAAAPTAVQKLHAQLIENPA